MFTHSEHQHTHRPRPRTLKPPASALFSYVLSRRASAVQRAQEAKSGRDCRSKQRVIEQATMAAVVAAASTSGMAGTKKVRKPYTVTNPRQKWSADEHDRFLHALALYGRDWKRIEAFVGTKTATQIRSHAQKHFLRAQKMGLAVPPVHPRRSGAAVRQAQPPVSCWMPSYTDVDAAVVSEDKMVRQLPLSPDHPDFALVYRFVGDIFGSDAPRPVDAQLQRLFGADPVIVETILCVLENLEANLLF